MSEMFHSCDIDIDSLIARLRILGENVFEIDSFRFLVFEDGSVRLSHIVLDENHLEVYLPYFSDNISVNITRCTGVKQNSGSHRLILDERYKTLETNMIYSGCFSEIYGEGIERVDDRAVQSTYLTKLVFPNCESEFFNTNGLKSNLYLELKDFCGSVEDLYNLKLNYFINMMKSGKAEKFK